MCPIKQHRHHHHLLSSRKCKHMKWKTTTVTPTGTSTNKRFNEQNNGSARAFSIFVHFFAVLCQSRTYFGEREPQWLICCVFGIERCHYIFSQRNFLDRWAYWTDLYSFDIQGWNINTLFARCRPWRRRLYCSNSLFIVPRYRAPWLYSNRGFQLLQSHKCFHVTCRKVGYCM